MKRLFYLGALVLLPWLMAFGQTLGVPTGGLLFPNTNSQPTGKGTLFCIANGTCTFTDWLGGAHPFAGVQPASQYQIPYFNLTGIAGSMAGATGITVDPTLNILSVAGGIGTGTSPPSACNGVTGCIAAGESNTRGTPTAGVDLLQADSLGVSGQAHGWIQSVNGGPWLPLGSATAGGIQSINADTTAAQKIQPGTGGITVSTTGGTTTIFNASDNLNFNLGLVGGKNSLYSYGFQLYNNSNTPWRGVVQDINGINLLHGASYNGATYTAQDNNVSDIEVGIAGGPLITFFTLPGQTIGQSITWPTPNMQLDPLGLHLNVGSMFIPLTSQCLATDTTGKIVGTPSGCVGFPPTGVPSSTGAAWGTSYTVGTAANNLPQLDNTGKLPVGVIPSSVPGFPPTGVPSSTGTAWSPTSYTVGSGPNNLPQLDTNGLILPTEIPILNQPTTGNAGTATQLATTPTLCATAGQFPNGIDVRGNALNCAAPPTGVAVSGTPLTNQVATFTGSNVIQGSPAFTFNTGTLTVGTAGTAGSLGVTGSTSGTFTITPNAGAMTGVTLGGTNYTTLFVPGGSVTATAIGLTGQSANNGLYMPIAGSLGGSSGGASAWYIDSTGIKLNGLAFLRMQAFNSSLLTVQSGLDSVASANIVGGSLLVRGPDTLTNSNNNVTTGSVTLRGGDNNGTGATETAGDLTIRPGMIDAPTLPATAANGGRLQLQVTGIKGTTVTANKLQCVSASAATGGRPPTYADCTVGGANEPWVGPNISTTGVGVTVQIAGDAAVLSNTAAQWVAGHFACLDGINAGMVVDGGTTACTAGQGVGIITFSDTATTTTHYVVLARF